MRTLIIFVLLACNFIMHAQVNKQFLLNGDPAQTISVRCGKRIYEGNRKLERRDTVPGRNIWSDYGGTHGILPGSGRVIAMAASPYYDNFFGYVLIEGAYGTQRIYVSNRDKYFTWNFYSILLPEEEKARLSTLIINPANPAMVCALNKDSTQIYYSFEAGSNWRNIVATLPRNIKITQLQFKDATQQLLITTNAGNYYSYIQAFDITKQHYGIVWHIAQ